jgi:hypothetical protein
VNSVWQEQRELWSWTARFTAVSVLALLFAAVQLNWFGLLPQTSGQLPVQAALLTLIGVFALRVSPLGMAIGLAVAFVSIFLDQATAGIGVTPLRFTPPSEFWTLNLSRVVLTWAAFPLLVWALGRILPPMAGGVAVAIALLPLPFIRYDNPGAIAEALATPASGRYLVLAVPWLLLCGAVAVLATLTVAIRLRRTALTGLVAAALAAATLIVPVGSIVITTQRAAAGVVVEPSAGGPLTEVHLRATFRAAGTPVFSFDDQRIVRNQYLFPLRTGVTETADTSFLPGAVAAALAPGAYRLMVQMGDERRESSYELVPPGGLSLSLSAERHVIATGGAGAHLRVLVQGPEGPELADVTLDRTGSWRSPLALPAGSFRIIAETDEGWTAMTLP